MLKTKTKGSQLVAACSLVPLMLRLNSLGQILEIESDAELNFAVIA